MGHNFAPQPSLPVLAPPSPETGPARRMALSWCSHPRYAMPVWRPALFLHSFAGECKRERPTLLVGTEPAVAIVITEHGSGGITVPLQALGDGDASIKVRPYMPPLCVSGPPVAVAALTYCSSPCIQDRGRSALADISFSSSSGSVHAVSRWARPRSSARPSRAIWCR